MNTVAFAAVIVAGELAVIWLAYSLGWSNGWLNGWEDRRAR